MVWLYGEFFWEMKVTVWNVITGCFSYNSSRLKLKYQILCVQFLFVRYKTYSMGTASFPPLGTKCLEEYLEV
jgi:hypothetical protein